MDSSYGQQIVGCERRAEAVRSPTDSSIARDDFQMVNGYPFRAKVSPACSTDHGLRPWLALATLLRANTTYAKVCTVYVPVTSARRNHTRFSESAHRRTTHARRTNQCQQSLPPRVCPAAPANNFFAGSAQPRCSSFLFELSNRAERIIFSVRILTIGHG
jgi:hypothetical protein